MMTKTKFFACLGFVAFLGCGDDDNTKKDAGTGGDAGNPTTFTVALTIAGEPTPCPMAMAGASGSATVTISGDGTQVVVTNLTFTGLSGAATLAHIHFGTATTASGPPVLSFGNNPTSPVTKTFMVSDYQAGSGAPATFAAFTAMARAGNAAYINIHTDKCPGGEIRGELQ